ncbi:MAG TPA: 3-oxoacyl-[acyl-carrier-protein] synthase III C-terminal domain-containing protein [Thermoanaerobaculia bacterium]|jgi:3-oxoacyl-[acyl-carrier-protein] synthase-3|nr:3-oxoacyl-[acyl-carrier-protein] synthase III C-terminal domain-containing protein [Thermoanaerobaculia bacterium]
MPQPRSLLLGTGVAVPPIRIDNHMLSRIVDTTDEWIQERSGIVTRYYVEPGVGSAELGAQAARGALAAAGVEASEVDYIVCATMTPDHYFPGSGTLVQQQLGIKPIPALDIRQQCAGFAYGLQVVDALIRSGIARTVLLVGCDVHTSLMPFSPRTWRVLYGEEDALPPDEFAWNSQFRHLLVLFGDAAGAMVFRAHEIDDGRGILGARLYGDGNEKDILHVPAVGSRRRPYVSHEIVDSGAAVPVMDGRAVFKYAVSRMPEVTRAVLADHGYTITDLDLLVMHQANLRINEAARKALDLPESKVHNNIQKYGNTTSATLPLAFHEARAEGKAPEGALVALTALGAGLHWGSVLMRV